jgi:hypothetical protein
VFACGDGHPVIVLPGFLCCDPMTSHFRRLLEGLGYPAAGWGAGINIGPTAASLSVVEALLQQITDRYGERASLVGQSLGGVFARSLADADTARHQCLQPVSAADGDPARADLSAALAAASRAGCRIARSCGAAAGSDHRDLHRHRRRRRMDQLRRRARAGPRERRDRRHPYDDAGKPRGRPSHYRTARSAGKPGQTVRRTRRLVAVQFVPDSPLEGGVTSELVSGIRRRASIWHFIPAPTRARARGQRRESRH